ncbi:MAG: hypothetical protein AB7V62_07025 [Thermoleophilia bacterium]
MADEKAKAKANHKLPRRPHADKIRPDERTLKQGGADLQNGWLGRHGNLVVTDDRLLFLPTLLDTALGAKRREIQLDAITEIERLPVSPGGMAPGGKRPRMLLHTDECVYELLVGDLDAWIDSLEVVYRRRNKAGKPHFPAITREDYVNLLLSED